MPNGSTLDAAIGRRLGLLSALAAPMIGLYGLGVLVAWLFGKDRSKDD